jgi:hypothetical protein
MRFRSAVSRIGISFVLIVVVVAFLGSVVYISNQTPLNYTSTPTTSNSQSIITLTYSQNGTIIDITLTVTSCIILNETSTTFPPAQISTEIEGNQTVIVRGLQIESVTTIATSTVC